MGLLIIYALIAIVFSFWCSVIEAVFLSLTPTYLKMNKKEGKGFAIILEGFKKDVDKPLIAILTFNTIAHTVGAILVGVQAKTAYAEIYGGEQTSFLGFPFSEDLMVGVVSSVMTILILIVSEIIPKTIGATYWRQLGNFTAISLKLLMFPLKYTGILWLLQLTTKLIGGKGHHSVMSRDGFYAMTQIAEEEGVFEASESLVIKNLLTFKKIQAKDVMTPRTVMKTVSEDMTVEEFFIENQHIRFSRIPIFKDQTDNITGLVLKDDIFREMANDNNTKKLVDIKRDIIITNRTLAIPKLLDQLVKSKNHMALVVDEYGSVSGIVTMEDVIETLLGFEIMDESDNIPDLQHLARKSWESRAKRLGIINDDDQID